MKTLKNFLNEAPIIIKNKQEAEIELVKSAISLIAVLGHLNETKAQSKLIKQLEKIVNGLEDFRRKF